MKTWGDIRGELRALGLDGDAIGNLEHAYYMDPATRAWLTHAMHGTVTVVEALAKLAVHQADAVRDLRDEHARLLEHGPVPVVVVRDVGGDGNG